jgi:ABC-type nitrate/sulfonate/bicarbonate transport system substrate-binding protein
MRSYLSALACCFALLLAGCGEHASAPPAETTAASIPLRLGVSASLLSAPLLIAAEQGLYEQAGLAPDIRLYQSGKAALAGLFAGEVDAATVADPPIMPREPILVQSAGCSAG